jgi:membrane-bound lytic murein transglycosylase B
MFSPLDVRPNSVRLDDPGSDAKLTIALLFCGGFNLMPNVDQQRKIREAAAYKREEEHRAERRVIEAKERERAKKDLDRKRYDDMAKAKQTVKKDEEMKEQEKKQEAWIKELEQKKYQSDQAALAQHAEMFKNAQQQSQQPQRPAQPQQTPQVQPQQPPQTPPEQQQ